MKESVKFLSGIPAAYRTARKAIRRFKYAGKGAHCPICQKDFRSWLHGQEFGPCPWCESQCRQRMLWLLLESRGLILDRPLRLLHFAPEEGLRARFQSLQGLDYVTADLSARGVDVQTDVTDLKFDANTFDIIICSHVLEHVQDDRVAMSELHRVLSFQGVAYIQVPYNSDRETDEDSTLIDPEERAKRFGQADHVRVYGVDLGARLRSAGFDVQEVRYARNLGPEDRNRYGLWDDVVFCCRKVD